MDVMACRGIVPIRCARPSAVAGGFVVILSGRYSAETAHQTAHKRSTNPGVTHSPSIPYIRTALRNASMNACAAQGSSRLPEDRQQNESGTPIKA
jgi:hypothetical protein